jgi:desulfoferrodoxin (superoxide reductase-like protein)
MLTLSRIRSTTAASLLLLLTFSTSAFADKASVTIIVPESVKKGTEVTIKIKVIHSGNNFIHHVDWAQISVDGKEVKRWDYSWTNKPESGTFEREFKYVVTAPIEVSSQADCNMHGNNGVVKAKINVTE